MKHTHSLVLATVTLPLLFAFAEKGDAVAFAPKEGAAVTKTFTTVQEFALDDMSILMDGQDSGMAPEMTMDMTMTQTVSVTDTYDSSKDGMPVKLSRTFDEIGQEIDVQVQMEMMGESQDQNTTGAGTSGLQGKTVEFLLEEGDFTKAFADGEEGEEEMLEGLAEDMDLRMFLPEDEVSEGDEWEVDLAGIVDVMAPGGDLSMDMELEGMDSPMGPNPSMMSDMRDMFGDMLEGECKCKYAGTREIDGAKVAVIEVSIVIDTANDMSDMMGEMMGDEVPPGLSIDRMDVEFSLKSQGELLWNLAGGHLYSFETEGEAEMTMDMEMGMDMGGQSMSMEMSMEMSGTVNQTVTTDE